MKHSRKVGPLRFWYRRAGKGYFSFGGAYQRFIDDLIMFRRIWLYLGPWDMYVEWGRNGHRGLKDGQERKDGSREETPEY